MPLAFGNKRLRRKTNTGETAFIEKTQMQVHQEQISNLVHNLYRGIDVADCLRNAALTAADAAACGWSSSGSGTRRGARRRAEARGG